MKKSTIKLIVNLLTLTRILGALLFPIIFTYLKPITCSIVLATLFITDALDGALARSAGVTTKGGFHLDQFCDKVLGIAVILALLRTEKLLFIPLALEVSISLVNILRASCNKSAASSKIGKIKTLFLSVELVCVTLDFLNISFISDVVVVVLIGLTAILELATLIGYIRDALNEKDEPNAKVKNKLKIKSFGDITVIIKRLWDENRFSADRDKSIQLVINEALEESHK